MDGRSKIGKWVGFDEPSNAHWIFWPEKRSITVERSVKFDDTDEVLVPFNAKQIQGEDKLEKNQQRIFENKNEQEICTSDQINPFQQASAQDLENAQQPEDKSLEIPMDHVPLDDPEEPELPSGHGHRVRAPSRYVQEIQEGIGAADNRISMPKCPAGMQIPKPKNLPAKNQNDDDQIEHAMAAAVSEIEAIDPRGSETKT